ncbi:hypothetical protein MNBD_GAMMA01-559, partial [hydrothermal vent metagenome]
MVLICETISQQLTNKNNIMKKLILVLLCLTSTLNAQQGVNPTTLVDPEWEFFDDFEGARDNTFWVGNGIGANYGVDRPDATSRVLEMVYIPNSEGSGDSWSEYDFNLVSNGTSMQAVQVEVSFKMFTPADYVPIEDNHKFFYLFSGNYGNSVANIVVNSEAWGNGSVALPSINPGIDQINYGHSWNMDQMPVFETGNGEWSTYQIFLELATDATDYGFYEIYKDGILLTATYAPNLNDWGWTGVGNPNFNGNELIKYATSVINNGGNFIDQGTLLGWANGDPNGGFLVDTKFLIDDFRIRANSVHGEVQNNESLDLIFSDSFEPATVALAIGDT